MRALLGKIADALSAGDGKRGWFATALGVVLAFIGLAVGAFVAWRNRAELARLRHAETVRHSDARKAEVDAGRASNDEKAAEALARAKGARERADKAAADLQAAEERYARDLRAVDRIRSWRDVDPDAR